VLYRTHPEQDLTASEIKKEETNNHLTAQVTEAETKQITKDVAAINYSRKAAKAKKLVQEVKLIHAVQPGDTLWNISKRYKNIPVEQIKKLNNLKNNEIKPGQKLVIS
jgi:membrane-bound lytic murein transglycosylase D